MLQVHVSACFWQNGRWLLSPLLFSLAQLLAAGIKYLQGPWILPHAS